MVCIVFSADYKDERLLAAGAPAIFSSLNGKTGNILFHQYLLCEPAPGLASIYVWTSLAYCRY